MTQQQQKEAECHPAWQTYVKTCSRNHVTHLDFAKWSEFRMGWEAAKQDSHRQPTLVNNG